MYHSKLVILPILLHLILLVLFCDGKIDCSSPPNRSCAFYEECLEAKYHCGPDGYPIGFGKKFCEVFEREIDQFSSRGQDFLWNNMRCLQHSLVAPFLHNNSDAPSDCQSLKETALDSHSTCFIQSGFCDIPTKDKLTLAKVFTENDISDVLWSFMIQGLDVLKSCYRSLNFFLQ